MSNQRNTVLYTGVTADLASRVWQHKTKVKPKSFTTKYNINKLVYYAISDDIEDAINFEKMIKKRSRKYKEQLINEMNPGWKDLSEEIGLDFEQEQESAAPTGHGIATVVPPSQ